MKYLAMAILALGFLTSGPVIAGDDCNCSKQCQERCARGDTKDCDCKTCDCKNGKKCKHGKCTRK